jgi:hypothetical protein
MHGPLQNHQLQSFMLAEPNFMVTQIDANALLPLASHSLHGLCSLPSKKEVSRCLILSDKQAAQ